MPTDFSFAGRIVFLGCGTVAKCALPMMRQLTGLPADRFTVIDSLDRSERLAAVINEGLVFRQRTMTRDNLDPLLSESLGNGDLLINISVGIGSLPVMD